MNKLLLAVSILIFSTTAIADPGPDPSTWQRRTTDQNGVRTRIRTVIPGTLYLRTVFNPSKYESYVANPALPPGYSTRTPPGHSVGVVLRLKALGGGESRTHNLISRKGLRLKVHDGFRTLTRGVGAVVRLKMQKHRAERKARAFARGFYRSR